MRMFSARNMDVISTGPVVSEYSSENGFFRARAIQPFFAF